MTMWTVSGDRALQAEASDPIGARWPRNKRGGDATVVFVAFDLGSE
jgi:hypothetical protein